MNYFVLSQGYILLYLHRLSPVRSDIFFFEKCLNPGLISHFFGLLLDRSSVVRLGVLLSGVSF